MGIIHVLPESLANKIAAGEVVERPASIVKELVENALDAGADSVEIAVNHGGKSFVQVSDTGCGMSPEDSELAFQRHATSKITSAEDLTRIASFGFRGEALPSIAAVSRVKLVTSARGDSAGTEIAIEGGRTVYSKGAAARKGTMVEIRDLFFNTPARRKFLRADSTELGHIQDTVSNIALAHLGVRFLFKSQDKVIFDLPPAANLRSRAAAIVGEDVAKHLLEIKVQEAGIGIQGLIGRPAIARANRSGQAFYVNRRWVRSFTLGYALLEGYHGLLFHGQHPVAVVFIEVDPERVDVNVHPTKQEVRISNEPEIRSLLKKVVTQCLEKEVDLAPHLRLARSPQGPRAPQTAWPSFAGTPAPGTEGISVAEPETAYPAADAEVLPEPISLREKLRITRVLGQLHGTFLVAETEEGYMLIDQHAAHERVMFEGLLRNIQSGHPERQSLLMGEVLEVHSRQIEILEHALPLLAQAGFEIDALGKNTYVVQSYPAVLGDDNPASFLRNFLDEKEEGRTRGGVEARAEDLAALIACKQRSVKAGDLLTPEAMRTLLERLSRCDNPFNCPHGRPTVIQQTLADLERQFKRK
jgi:DNA mismatch repair protein MutL